MNNIIYVFNLTLNSFPLFDLSHKQSNTCIRTPEPTELCELYSMYILADWLYYASQNTIISQDIYLKLPTYLDTTPSIGKYHRNLL